MCTTAPDHEDHLDEECLPAVSDEQRDSLLLNLMLCEDQAFPWSREELARTIGNQIGAFDAVARLEEDGLVHRVGEFVFPTRACRRAGELDFGR
jgi:hypothetical protein